MLSLVIGSAIMLAWIVPVALGARWLYSRDQGYAGVDDA